MKKDSHPIPDSARFRELLLMKKSELTAEMGLEIPRLSDSGQLSDDDQAQALHDQFVTLEFQQRCYQTLREINTALDRLTTGDYGICVDCGEPINYRRLLAIPWAARCLQCQERRTEGVEEFHERAA